MAGNVFSKVAAAIIVLTADPSYAIECREHIGEKVRGRKNRKEGAIIKYYKWLGRWWCKVRIDYDPSEDPFTYTTAVFLNRNLNLNTDGPTTDPIKYCVKDTEVWMAEGPNNKKSCTIVRQDADNESHCLVVCAHDPQAEESEAKNKMWLWSLESEKMTENAEGFYWKKRKGRK